jgi:TetR/AcrR family transcriptional repressor of lmrAB and yxaGH operons
MASRSEVRARMISAGRDLISERGYRVTLLEVVERADAPRGSIYYHFPKGKLELQIEVAIKVGRDLDRVVARVSREIAEPVAFLQELVDRPRKRLVRTGYEMSCPLVGMIAGGDVDSPELETAIREAFDIWTAAVARELGKKGFPPAKAEQLASLLVTGIEGAVMVARAKRSQQPFADLSKLIPTLVAGVLATDVA